MTNGEKFKSEFGIYATELWAMPEDGFLKWLKAKAEPRWIPVTEMMPIIENNISVRVLITTSWGVVKEAYYCVDHWEIDDFPYKLTSAIAWMPLPEPYREVKK